VLGKVPLLQQTFSSLPRVLQRLARLYFSKSAWLIPHLLATAQQPSPDWTVVVVQSALMLRRDLALRGAGVVLLDPHVNDFVSVAVPLFEMASTETGTHKVTLIQSSPVSA
jgi:hypothetical protein